MVVAVAVSVLLQSGLVLPDGQNFVSTSRRQALLHAAGAASLCFFPAAPALADASTQIREARNPQKATLRAS